MTAERTARLRVPANNICATNLNCNFRFVATIGKCYIDYIKRA